MRDLAKRKWPLVLAATAGLVVAGYAAAANVSVLLGPQGPQPSVVSVGWGHTLDLVNGDTVAHGLASSRPALNAAAVIPGATFSAVMTGRAGTVVYDQTAPKRYPGTVVVVLSGSVSLHKPAHPVPYGRQLHVSGQTNPATAVAIEQRLAGDSAWETIKTVTSGADGSFATGMPLAIGGKLRASIDGGQLRSHRVTVSVAPRITVAASRRRAPVGSHVTLTAHVSPAASTTHLYLYGCIPARGKWHRIATARTSASGAASFHGRVVPGMLRLRATVRQHGIAPGYAASTSRTVSVTGTGKAPQARHGTRHHC